jgi:toxin FitB
MRHVALDTSAAVPLLVRKHAHHGAALEAVRDATISMTGHSLAETYSVLTRLPGDARLAPHDAAQLLSDGFAEALMVAPATLAELPATLARRDIAGGAVYDALVALAVFDTEVTLLTRDQRAAVTYDALGITWEFV